ncbi:hypothetical protein CMV_016423 [Castanea mollissima]|uniref:Matrin-type domain-containing protein n=1 Tax=Castanea mollissima TaxID=60419 RepID=A0A8J4R6I0_9ROSI|nr:hypothetical protein CMV_016423 [Castanea mollissima]
MTEYWVSQGNKWCDFCKIFISNNPSSIRNHELGQRHKDNVSKRLDSMRKEGAAKEKEKKEATRALEQIEAKAKRSYQKDIAKLQEVRDSHAQALNDQDEEWEYDSTSGYYYNKSNGFYNDPNSGFYYSDAVGKWVTQEEAYATPQFSSNSKHKVLHRQLLLARERGKMRSQRLYPKKKQLPLKQGKRQRRELKKGKNRCLASTGLFNLKSSQNKGTVQTCTRADKTDRHRPSCTATATDRRSRCRQSEHKGTSDPGAVQSSELQIPHQWVPNRTDIGK